jgi:hypothetical protein
MKGLDAWITGHYGEDQFRGEEEEEMKRGTRYEVVTDFGGYSITYRGGGNYTVRGWSCYQDAPTLWAVSIWGWYVSNYEEDNGIGTPVHSMMYQHALDVLAGYRKTGHVIKRGIIIQ